MAVRAARVVFSETDRAEVSAAITDILTSGALTLGPYTRRFEEAFAAAHGAVHAIATSSGTSALEIVLRSLDVAGRDVVVPANTFYATAAAALRAGARPVFADIDAATFAMSPQTLTAALTPSTAAVVLVHVGGLITPDAAELRRICEERGAALVEDAAHAHGATMNGLHAGSFGVAAAFSFYPTKIVTSGEGGMILTASQRLADEARIYRDQGKGSFGLNHHVRHGYAWRMSEQNAATGLVHLRGMERAITRRREVAARYDAAMRDLAGVLRPLAEPEGCRGNVYKYIAVLTDGVDRDWFKCELADRHDVHLAGEVYDTPLHLQPVLAPYATGQLAAAERMCRRHVCLPVHSDMRDDEATEVIAALTAVAAQAGERACASR